MLHLAQGDKYATDFNAETLKSDVALTKPGSAENTQIQAALTAALVDRT